MVAVAAARAASVLVSIQDVLELVTSSFGVRSATCRQLATARSQPECYRVLKFGEALGSRSRSAIFEAHVP